MLIPRKTVYFSTSLRSCPTFEAALLANREQMSSEDRLTVVKSLKGIKQIAEML